MRAEKKLWFRRLTVYLIGVVVLNFGVALALQADLGASSSLSLPYAVSLASGAELSKVVVLVYGLEVAAQFVLRKKKQWRDILQIPVALFLGFLLNRFETLGLFHYELLWQRLVLMLAGILCIGVGVFLSVNMRLVPAPPEGLLDAITQRSGLNMGLVKNLQDGVTVALALLIDLIFRHRVDAVGISTVCSMLLIGRVVALCSRLFLKRLLTATGLPEIQK